MKTSNALAGLLSCLLLGAGGMAHADDFLWAKSAGGTSTDEGNGIAVDGNGNTLVTGFFTGTATFAGVSGPITLTSAGAADIFVAKYDANGNCLWATRAGGTGSDQGLGIAVDGNGNTFVTGRFFDTATFAGVSGPITLTSAGSGDIFVAKYDANGNCLSAKSAGSPNGDLGLGITVDGSGNTLVTGFFGGTATFAGVSGPITLTNASASFGEIFVAKLGLANARPTVTCPPDAMIHCTSLNAAVRTVTIGVADENNVGLTVVWSVDGNPVALHALTAGATSDSLVDYPFPVTAPFVHTVAVAVTDGLSDPVTCETKVTVVEHGLPAPSLPALPDITGECSASITEAPTAIDDCDDIEHAGIITGTPMDALDYAAQGTFIVTWKYTDPHDATRFTLQPQNVVVKDITPPTISCPANVSVAYGAVPAAATAVAEFSAQGAALSDNCNPSGTVNSADVADGTCPIVITRDYTVTDAAANASYCSQTITVNNLFAGDGIIWHQPLARNGASEDTDPGDNGTLKYRFKLGSTIPIKVHAQGCNGSVTGNANVTGKVVVFGDTDMDGVIDAGELAIDYNGVGEAGGVMDKIDGHLKYNLDTKKLVQTFKCYILQVTVTDSSTGESSVETVPLQAK